MLKITPVTAFTDNYIWTIEQAPSAVCIDPGAAEPVLQFLQKNHLTLDAILITHHHLDHTGGIDALSKHYPQCQVYGPANIPNITQVTQEHDSIQTAVGTFHTWDIGGHTQSHLGYFIESHFFCGDTLFSAGCGRVFDGTITSLFHSLQKINTLPEYTLLYPAHEHTLNNLKFALTLEPDNPNLQAAFSFAQEHKPTLPTSLEHERLINPFLRTNQTEFIKNIQKNTQYPTKDALTLFTALRKAKDNF